MNTKPIILGILFGLLTLQTINSQPVIKDTIFLAEVNNQFWGSSSELELTGYSDYGKYGSTNLGDNNPATCWAEGSEKDGVGEYIFMSIPKNIRGIKIRNGFQKSESLYKANNRPKIIKIELLPCFMPSGFVTETHFGFAVSQSMASLTKELDDKLGLQAVLLDFNWNDLYKKISETKNFDKDRFILKITIKDIYNGDKWNDACISDIILIQNPVFDVTADDKGFIRTYEGQTDTLFYDPENVYQVIDLTDDSEWIIFIQMPADIENSRAETIYKLYNTKKEAFIDTEDITQMYGFIEKDGRVYLEGVNNDFEERNLLLEDVKINSKN
ncbi:MAG: NADase-type glycan-binding domain-containing protein [Thiohalospira sp.]